MCIRQSIKEQILTFNATISFLYLFAGREERKGVRLMTGFFHYVKIMGKMSIQWPFDAARKYWYTCTWILIVPLWVRHQIYWLSQTKRKTISLIVDINIIINLLGLKILYWIWNMYTAGKKTSWRYYWSAHQNDKAILDLSRPSYQWSILMEAILIYQGVHCCTKVCTERVVIQPESSGWRYRLKG